MTALRPADAQLIAIACAHHRMAWMHPKFAGWQWLRVALIQTHAAMLPITQALVGQAWCKRRERLRLSGVRGRRAKATWMAGATWAKRLGPVG